MSPSQLFFWAVPIIALLSYCLLMLFITISKKDELIRLFMLLLTAMIVWTASSLFMKLQLYPGVIFWNRMMVAGMFSVPFLLYYFVSVFTKTLNKLRTVIWGIIVSAAIIINFLGYVVTKAEILTHTVTEKGLQNTSVEFVYSLGMMAIPMYALYFILLLGILNKARTGVKNADTTYGQIGLITLGVFIMFIGVAFNVLPSLGKYPVDILACFINAILIMVAIYKYRLLELRFMVTKGIVFSLFAVLLTAMYVYLVLFVERNMEETFRSVTPYFTILLALLVAVIFQPLYGLVRKIVDRIFYKTEYSQRQALRNFSVSISGKLDLDHIAGELIEAVQVSIRSRKVFVLLKDEEKAHYYVFRSSSQIDKLDLDISFDNPIVKWLIINNNSFLREELHTLPLFKSMWDSEKKTLYDANIEVIIPIKSRDDLIGMLMLTSRNNNTAYTLDDLDLLTYLGISTAVVFDNARLYARAQAEALTDIVTNLHNHRYFRKALREHIEKIGSGELSLLMIDLDLFKLYNDLFGHCEGDNALKKVASIMVHETGQRGIVCRYGGEEFVVLLPHCDSKKAYDLAEKIRLKIQKAFLNTPDVTQRFLTVSIGVCTYPYAAPNEEELLKRADLAMYTAKNKGKNQTVIYTPKNFSNKITMEDSSENIWMAPAYATTLYALTATIDTKDHYTFGHSQRVAEYATILANSLGLDKSHLEMIREAALLHDIGKIGIPESILTKSGRLTDDEFEVVKRHVEMSMTIIKHLPSFNHVAPAVIGHHERWDGKGYPRGLMVENIPLAARCLAVADAFDAMTSDRPYRKAFSVSAALKEIENNIGTQFDPKIAGLFIKLVKDGTINVEQDMRLANIV